MVTSSQRRFLSFPVMGAMAMVVELVEADEAGRNRERRLAWPKRPNSAKHRVPHEERAQCARPSQPPPALSLPAPFFPNKLSQNIYSAGNC